MSFIDKFVERAVVPPATAAQAEAIAHLRSVLVETAALMFSIIEDHADPQQSARLYREWLLQADGEMARPSFGHAAAYLRGLELYPGEIVGGDSPRHDQ